MIGRDWTAGMEVVCIVGGDRSHWGPLTPAARGICPPVKGKVYHVSGIEYDETEELIYVALKEYAPDVGFDARGFRPVQPRKTDISVFTALLNTSKQKEDA